MVTEWAAQAPNLDVSALEVVGRLFLCAERGRHMVQDALRPLRRRGDRRGIYPRVLAAATLITSGAMTARVDRLVSAGYVERRPDPDDRRSILIRLTKKGERIAERALDGVLAADEDFLHPLTRKQRDLLATELKRLLVAHESR